MCRRPCHVGSVSTKLTHVTHRLRCALVSLLNNPPLPTMTTKRSVRVFAVAALCAASLSACTDDAEPTALPEWRLIEEWKVGGEADGPLSFDNVRGMRPLADGRLALLNGTDQSLVILSAEGAPSRVVGRKGAGPNEYANVSGLAVSPSGEIVVADFGNQRFTVLSDSGEFQRTIPATRTLFGTSWKGFFDSTGVLYDPVVVRRGPVGTETVWVRRRLPDLAAIDTAPLHSCPDGIPSVEAVSIPVVTSTGRRLLMRRPFAEPVVASVADADGFEWSPRTFDTNELAKRQIGTCTTTAVAALQWEREPVTEADKERSRASVVQYAQQVRAPVPEIEPFRTHHPWYVQLLADSERRLWVHRMTTRRATFHVYQPDGTPAATVVVPPAISVAAPTVITGDRFYALIMDNDGVQYLASYRIER